MGGGCRAEPPHHTQIPDRHAKTRDIIAADRCRGGQPEPSPYGAKYTEEEERLDLSKGKKRFRKMGFAEPSLQTEPKRIPFTPGSRDCRKRVGNSRRAAGRTQQRWIPVCLHPEA